MPRPRTYTEDEIAAEEEKIGSRLPDELRSRYRDGIQSTVVLKAPGYAGIFETWAPTTTTTDKKGRPYPTRGMHAETEEVRSIDDDFAPDDVVVGWAADASGDLAVVLRDGSLAWWHVRGEELVPVEVDWDPSGETLERADAGEPL